MFRTRLLLAAAAVLLPTVASAQAFNFETVAAGPYSSLVQSSGGQTLTVTTTGNGGYVFADFSQVPGFGAISLIGSQTNALNFNGFSPLRFSFLNAVSAITFVFGDGGGDIDTPARVTAYDASNALLGVFDAPYGQFDYNGGAHDLTFGGAGASYFILSSPAGDGNDDSLFWEITASTQASVVATPEPASLVLMATGLGLIGGIVRRRRSKA